MKNINKFHLIEITLLIIGYLPYSPVQFGLDLSSKSVTIMNNTVQSVSLWVIPTTAFIASLLVIKSFAKSNGINKVIAFGVLLFTVFITFKLNFLTDEEKMLKILGSKKESFVIGKTYLKSDFVTQSNDNATIFFSKYLWKKDSKDHKVEAEDYLLQLLQNKPEIDTGAYNDGESRESSIVGVDFKLSIKSSFTKPEDQDVLGLAKAVNDLGYIYFKGMRVKQDYSKALGWYQKAADQGHLNAQNNLGSLYFHGKGVEQDYRKAMQWYQKAADKGHTVAQNNIAILYVHGKGVEQDYRKAMQWYQKAANKGHAVSQYDLGLLYANGQGVEQSYSKAVFWFKKSAEQGSALGQNSLGSLYAQGQGVELNYNKAISLYQKAIEQGHDGAYKNLGSLYFHGKGVKQDYSKAISLWQKASELGDVEASRYIDIAKKKLQE